MAKRRKVGNLLALALLALLAPGRPMHPYQMAGILRRTGKEQDMKIKWGSLYTVVQNLEKHGLIEETGSQREGRRPERTVYAITDAGRAEVRDWLRELVAEPEPELHRFEAALSVLGVLPPDEVIELLAARLRALDENIARQRKALKQSEQVPRLFLVEAEYALAMTQAEAAWVSGLRKELMDGSLAGIQQWRDYHETGEPISDWERLLEEE
ncbi:PadR family transcriptional regulator [Rhizocola hellebori]|uniref:PadR family transcriptional regulator n=1 Tax=Rhizocola hellebori TaxID=1392758 RepID=A0A8J3QFE6_9ACTN|nr:PadR family transcriptional regulator [Rhizocola hellebori]GIH08602.1 PadR family transcriptional regulator [Rhizocola hellebori]